jgi:hypothetical protein
MPIRRTTRFDKAHLALPPPIRAKVDRALLLLDENGDTLPRRPNGCPAIAVFSTPALTATTV